MAKSPIYAGGHQRRAAALVAQATANPGERCMAHCTCEAITHPTCTCKRACGRTLDQHTGRGARWSAGHTHPNDPAAPIRPEVLACNIAERNQRINQRRDRHTERW